MCDRSDRKIGDKGNGQTATSTPYLLLFSANNRDSLELVRGLSKLDISSVSISDLAYTLSERRSHLSLRGYIIARQETLAQDLHINNIRVSSSETYLAGGNFAFIFTG